VSRHAHLSAAEQPVARPAHAVEPQITVGLNGLNNEPDLIHMRAKPQFGRFLTPAPAPDYFSVLIDFNFIRRRLETVSNISNDLLLEPRDSGNRTSFFSVLRSESLVSLNGPSTTDIEIFAFSRLTAAAPGLNGPP
jgi:hypothetical protein